MWPSTFGRILPCKYLSHWAHLRNKWGKSLRCPWVYSSDFNLEHLCLILKIQNEYLCCNIVAPYIIWTGLHMFFDSKCLQGFYQSDPNKDFLLIHLSSYNWRAFLPFAIPQSTWTKMHEFSLTCYITAIHGVLIPKVRFQVHQFSADKFEICELCKKSLPYFHTLCNDLNNFFSTSGSSCPVAC